MTTMIKYVFQDILRTRFILAYTLFLMVTTIALFQLSSDSAKVTLSLLNVVLMVVPLVSIVFATINYFNSYEFITLLLSQPIQRKSIFLSQYSGVASSLAIAFAAGVGIPSIIFGGLNEMITLLLVGMVLSLVFVSLAFLASVLTQDKAKAIGIALLFWFYFSLLYDGLLLMVVYSFSDYPIEKITLALVSFNPIDLARIVMLLTLDISALMGYTGAFYNEFFGSAWGITYSLAVLSAWILLPLFFALRIFNRKDL